MNIFFWFVVYILKAIFSIFYRYKVYGTKTIYPHCAIIAPNHASFLDPPLIGASWPEEVHFLARATLFKNWFMQLLLNNLNTHPVHGSAQDLASFKTICQLLSGNKKVVIFPEGVRTSTGELQEMKTGVAMLALRAKCPIIPAYIHGTFDVWPRFQKWPRLTGRVACVFGKPIFVEPYLKLEKKQAQEALSQQVQKSIEELRNWLEKGATGELP